MTQSLHERRRIRALERSHASSLRPDPRHVARQFRRLTYLDRAVKDARNERRGREQVHRLAPGWGKQPAEEDS